MIKTFFKKFKGAFEQIIGSAIVVCAEVVINKKWNPNTDFIGNALRVPSKNFYDYLGHTLVPDEGLKDNTEGGIGLGLGPYNNDLGHAVDKDTFSSPSPVSFSSDTIETGESITGTGGTRKYNNDGDSVPAAECAVYDYDWAGDWGDTLNKFQTSATFQVKINYNVKKTGGGIFPGTFQVLGVTISMPSTKDDTGALSWHVTCGSENDQTTENLKLYYNGGFANQQNNFQSRFGIDPGSSDTPITVGNAFTFFNPHYSSGSNFVRDDDIGVQVHTFTVHRKPFEKTLKFYTAYAGEAGKYSPFPAQQTAEAVVNAIFTASGGLLEMLVQVLNLVGSIIVNIINVLGSLISAVSQFFTGSAPSGFGQNRSDIGNVLKEAFIEIFVVIFEIINSILRFIMGADDKIPAYLNIDVVEINRQEMTLSHQDFLETRMNKFWGGVFEKSYVYSQFWYPDFNKNPIFSYADTFNFREPFLNNLVVENPYHNDTFRSDNPYTKKYKFFVPSLFSLLYETNLGAFYEQLAKLHNTEALSRLKPKFNLNIKIVDFNVPVAYYEFINQQQKTIYDLMLPSNIDISENLLLEYANNTGYTDTTEATSAATIGAIVAGATPIDTKKNASYPSEYNSVFTDYPFLSAYKGSITDINTVIGDFSDIKAKLEADDGLKLETWTNYCNSSDFSTLSTGVPRNLAYKLIEYILWYVDPEGIVDEIRQDVRSLIAYEKFLDQDIDEYRKSSDGSDFENFHIIGTEIYQRNCPPDSNSFT